VKADAISSFNFRLAHPDLPPTLTSIQLPDISVPWEGKTAERRRRPVTPLPLAALGVIPPGRLWSAANGAREDCTNL